MKSLLQIFLLISFTLLNGINAEAFLSDTPPKAQLYFIPGEEGNPEEAAEFAREKLSSLHEAGFLEARIDSILFKDQQYAIYIFRGEEYFYLPGNISATPMALQKVQAAGFIKDTPLSFPVFNDLLNQLLEFYANNGYPFASIQKQNIVLENNSINLDLTIDPGEKIIIDKIGFSGNTTIHQSFIGNITGIRPGASFNESLINDIPKKISELDFVRQTGPIEIGFTPGKSEIIIPVQRINSNRFDGIAGLSGGGDPQIPVSVTGQLGLYLSNAFSRGEFLNLRWQAPGNSTQILDLSGGFPYPAGLPVKTEALFTLHKQDTSWLQTGFRPTIMFHLGTNKYLGAFWHYTSSTILGSITNHANSFFDEYIMNQYGLEYRQTTTAYFINLLQPGSHLKISTSAGKSQQPSARNSEIVSDRFDTNRPVFSLRADFEKRYLTGPRATFSAGISGSYLSGERIPENQHFRLGGFRNLRGFDELSILASFYIMANTEFRFFTGNRSFFSFFANGGWYEQRISLNYFKDTPAGIGLGLNQETVAGIFSINLATGFGKTAGTGFRNAKVHIGYISTF